MSKWYAVLSLLFGLNFRVCTETQRQTFQSNSRKVNPFMILAPEDLPLYIRPALLAGEVKKIARAMAEIPVERAMKNLNAIFKSAEHTLSHADKIILLLEVLRNYSNDLEKQKKLLDMLIMHTSLYQGEPLLFVVAKHRYQDVAPVILAWMEHEKRKGTALDTYLKNMVFSAFDYAIEKNMPQPFNTLLWAGFTLPEKLANQLLWLVVNKQKNSDFIALLKTMGATMDVLKDGTYTPLIRATELNNKELVHALLKAGAQPNLIADPATGSALQTAIGHGYREIEMLLREYEAKEPLPKLF